MADLGSSVLDRKKKVTLVLNRPKYSVMDNSSLMQCAQIPLLSITPMKPISVAYYVHFMDCVDYQAVHFAI